MIVSVTLQLQPNQLLTFVVPELVQWTVMARSCLHRVSLDGLHPMIKRTLYMLLDKDVTGTWCRLADWQRHQDGDPGMDKADPQAVTGISVTMYMDANYLPQHTTLDTTSGSALSQP